VWPAATAARVDFDDCLAALTPAARDHPGIHRVLDDVRRADAYKDAVWNVNEPYRSGAINLLMPTRTSDAWPAACGLSAEPADCLADPEKGFILCNPAMGERFASPLLHSGIANAETHLAVRFLVLTFLGHELGHLADKPATAVRHLVVPDHLFGMKCQKPPANDVESRADELGIELACSALRGHPAYQELAAAEDEGARSANILKTLFRLQDDLDERYFTMDDACIAVEDHPSISRRKTSFASSYLQCFFPENLVNDLAREYLVEFDKFEAWLRTRQQTGYLASGSYGLTDLYSHTVTSAGAPHSYLTFDSSGTDSTLWNVHAGTTVVLERDRIRDWSHTAKVFQVVPGPGGAVIAIRGGSRDDGKATCTALDVRCGESGSCTITSETSRDIDARSFPLSGSDGSVLLNGPKDSFERYGSLGDFFAGRPSHKGSVRGFLPDAEKRVVATTRTRTLFVPERELADLSTTSGFQSLTVVDGRRRYERTLHQVSRAGYATLDSAALADGRFLFTVTDRNPVRGPQLRLWDCPEGVLADSREMTTSSCTVYTPPPAPAEHVATLTRDISALADRTIETSLPGCGTFSVIHNHGWLWLLDRTTGRQDMVAGDGVVECSDGIVTTFRARRVDMFEITLTPADREIRTLSSLPAGAR